VYLPTKAKGTQQRDRGTIAHLLAFGFGNRRLDQIKRSDCEGYVNARRAAFVANPGRKTRKLVSEGTVMRELRFLHAVFQRAVDDDLIERNPWKGIKRTRDQVRERLLTEADEAKLLAQLSPRFSRFVRFLLLTGLRLDECRGIDAERDISDAGVRVTGKGRKVRTVPLVEAARTILDEQRKADGKLWTQNPQRLREVLAQASARAGIGHRSPHDLRHEFGRRWIVAGGDVFVLSRILGHSDVATTTAHYASLLQDDLKAKMLSVMQPAATT
jgi:integrase